MVAKASRICLQLFALKTSSPINTRKKSTQGQAGLYKRFFGEMNSLVIFSFFPENSDFLRRIRTIRMVPYNIVPYEPETSQRDC